MNDRSIWKEIDARERQLTLIVEPARKSFEGDVARAAGAASAWSGHFGATGIDPRHLLVYFVVPTRSQVDAVLDSDAWTRIRSGFLARLAADGFPVDSLDAGSIRIFSQQACDEEHQGNWYHFFK
jgi:hypothetical protein